MMENLNVILEKKSELIAELEAILAEEIRQLSRPQINPVSLQIVSDAKSKLLSSISYYDEIRCHEEKRLDIAAPYHDDGTLSARWHNIRERASQANMLNQQIHALLNMHMQKTSDLQLVVGLAGKELTTYDADGAFKNNIAGKVYNVTI
ncbi:Flagellar biosynthesis protein flgN [Enterobacter cancerogenus]|uniref:flagella synthesis protein FlgN n=1 Tax=Enterobacter cancerogenus TaxID=69218 RepID=UPI0019280F9A|nr:flagellar export chaperone FlgN [Enterobacter cancerogenus]CAD5358491.1 Flagellar biosynthesis protein flgN [Enterobacter cancerogenus]